MLLARHEIDKKIFLYGDLSVHRASNGTSVYIFMRFYLCTLHARHCQHNTRTEEQKHHVYCYFNDVIGLYNFMSID